MGSPSAASWWGLTGIGPVPGPRSTWEIPRGVVRLEAGRLLVPKALAASGFGAHVWTHHTSGPHPQVPPLGHRQANWGPLAGVPG